jgi:hypothetical protein
MVHDTSKAMEISADLQELTRCPVGLVSAGVKSILDIGRSGSLTDVHGRTLLLKSTLSGRWNTSYVARADCCPSFTQCDAGNSRSSGRDVRRNPRLSRFLLPEQWVQSRCLFRLICILTHLDSLGFRAHGELMIQLPLQTSFVRGI